MGSCFLGSSPSEEGMMVTQDCGRRVRNDEHTQEGYSYGNALKFCTFVQNVGINLY